MEDKVSRQEFDRLYHTLETGFAGVHSRLDVLNGRTGKGEIADAELRQRVTSLEKEVFAAPRRRAGDPAPAVTTTKQERVIIAFGLAVMVLVTKLAFLAGDVALDGLKTLFKGAH